MARRAAALAAGLAAAAVVLVAVRVGRDLAREPARTADGHCVLRTDGLHVAGTRSLGTIELDRVARHHVWLTRAMGDRRDDVPFDRRTDNLNVDGLYRLSRGGRSWHFRFGGNAFDPDGSRRTLLHELQWADGRRPGGGGAYALEVVDTVRPVADPARTLAIVGDSITWWQRGEWLRCRMRAAGDRHEYVGSRTDTFGHGHEGEGGNTTVDVAARLSWIVPAAAYLLIVGTNDRDAPAATAQRIVELARALRERAIPSPAPVRVHVATLLPRTDGHAGLARAVSAALRERFARCGADCAGLALVDLEAALAADPRWRTGLEADGLHPNDDGYRALAEVLVAHLAPRAGH